MPHFPRPFFRKPRGLWYVEINGHQVNLGPDKDEAFRRYHELMATKAKEIPKTPRSSADIPVVSVLDLFLEWCETHKARLTYVWYQRRCQWFLDTIPAKLTIGELKPFHLQQWVDKNPDWSNSHKRGCTIAIQRAFRWAEKMGHIDKNPVRNVEKPEAGRRDQVITPAEFETILGCYPDQEFRDVLTFCYETGCRPQELVVFEARHLDLTNSRLVLPADEAKGKKRIRVVYLTDKALMVFQRLTNKHPDGKIFRNVDGEPWTADAINCRFCRLQQKLGKKYFLGAFRHTLATRLLEAGVDSLTVSTLLGHKDGTMLARHYAHISNNGDHLRNALNRGRLEDA